MLKKAFASTIGASPKAAISSMFLLANAFVWYFYATRFLTDTLSVSVFSGSELSVWGANILGIVVAAILGIFLIYRFKKRVVFIRYWLLAGVFLSLAPLMFGLASFDVLLVFSLLAGVYFGLGLPVAFGYFAASTKAKNRARMGGLTFATIFGIVFLLRILGITDVAISAVVLASLQAGSLGLTFLLNPEEKEIASSDRVSYRFIFTNKSFLLYFVPWIMFSVVNYMATPIVDEVFPEDFFLFFTMIENILAAVSALVFGFLGDYFGRKRLVVSGFVLMGLGYASLGLFQSNVLSWCFYTVADGTAWGIFYTIFFMTIWGDFAQGKSSEKYYMLGSLPFLALVFMQLSLQTYMSSFVSKDAVFSFASLFLFLAVLPLVYAPETLPEKIVKERELKSYLEQAQRARTLSDSANS